MIDLASLTAVEPQPEYRLDLTLDEVTASAAGRRIRFPESNELFLDLDTPDSVTGVEKLLAWYQTHVDPGACETERTPSKTPGHYHAVALGTDPKHTMIALIQLDRGADPGVVTVFFEDL